MSLHSKKSLIQKFWNNIINTGKFSTLIHKHTQCDAVHQICKNTKFHHNLQLSFKSIRLFHWKIVIDIEMASLSIENFIYVEQNVGGIACIYELKCSVLVRRHMTFIFQQNWNHTTFPFNEIIQNHFKLSISLLLEFCLFALSLPYLLSLISKHRFCSHLFTFTRCI